MAKVEIITPQEKFNPTQPIADKQERVLQMLRLMALSYQTRNKSKKEIKDPDKPVFIELRKNGAK